MSFTQQINQSLLDMVFGPGKIQAGDQRGEIALSMATPAQRDAYLKARQAYQPGYNFALPYAGGSLSQYNGGVSPVGQVEPLNDWQKATLTSMNTGYTDPGYSSGAFQAYTNAGNVAGSVPTQLTDQQFGDLYKRYFNPYTQDVVNSTTDEIRRNGDILKNQLKEKLAATNSFGSTAQGVESGIIDDATLRQIGQTTSALNSSGFAQAVSNALGNYGTDFNNSLNKASALRSQAQLGQTGSTSGLNDFITGLQSKLYAGDRVQQQNQNLLDVVRGQIGNVQNYPYSSLNNFAGLLAPFSGSSGTGYNYTASPVSQLGGLGILAGSGYFNNYGGIK